MIVELDIVDWIHGQGSFLLFNFYDINLNEV